MADVSEIPSWLVGGPRRLAMALPMSGCAWCPSVNRSLRLAAHRRRVGHCRGHQQRQAPRLPTDDPAPTRAWLYEPGHAVLDHAPRLRLAPVYRRLAFDPCGIAESQAALPRAAPGAAARRPRQGSHRSPGPGSQRIPPVLNSTPGEDGCSIRNNPGLPFSLGGHRSLALSVCHPIGYRLAVPTQLQPNPQTHERGTRPEELCGRQADRARPSDTGRRALGSLRIPGAGVRFKEHERREPGRPGMGAGDLLQIARCQLLIAREATALLGETVREGVGRKSVIDEAAK